ncbi:MAG: quinoprotein dehydrogenase-associated SoxYZ-like carrier [Proteobacteria bacterium]|nr:quinoprotein dehydrogenase-associated SoxYZ-like carrier [Pseudomonadota bacterium]
MTHTRLVPGLVTAAVLLTLPPSGTADETPAVGAWQNMRPHLYGERPISESGDELMTIEAPASTPDPAATAVTVHFGEGLEGRVRQVRVIIDNNPSPLAATFTLRPGLALEALDLRVRIDRYTSVRAIAETTDGQLEMRSAWVNAAGGCSTPPSAAPPGTLGEVRFRPSADGHALQVSIRHPNNSGFQIDPRSGDPIPPHFISRLRLLAGDEVLVDAETGISLSENPTLRLRSRDPMPSPLKLEATDIPSQQLFTATWTASPAAGTR